MYKVQAYNIQIVQNFRLLLLLRLSYYSVLYLLPILSCFVL